ncbi:MAG: M56 family metallopeptidase [Pyrinomonadaceae bacterium]
MSLYVESISFITLLTFNLWLFGTPLAAGVWIAFRLTPRYSPRSRYVIAVIAFCLAPFYPIFGALGSINVFPNAKSEVQDASQVNPERLRANSETPDRSQNHGRGSVSTRITALELNIRAAITSVARSSSGIAIFFIWLLGSAWLLAKEIYGHLTLRQQRMQWTQASADMCQELHWASSVPLLLDDDTGPGTVGLLRPVVVIPSALISTLTPEAARQIARHELSHARWRDPLISAFLRLTRAALWISPPLWLLEKSIGLEREVAADRDAIGLDHLADTNRDIAIDYASSLVQMVHQLKRGAIRKDHELLAIQFGHKAGLEKRVKRLLIPISQPSIQRMALAILIILAGIAIASSLTVSVPAFSAVETDLSVLALGDIIRLESVADRVIRQNSDQMEVEPQTDRARKVEGIFSNETGRKEFKFTIGPSGRPARLYVKGNLSSGKVTWALISPSGERSFGLQLEADEGRTANGHGASEKLSNSTGEWTVKIEAKNASGTFELEWSTHLP